MRVRMAICVSDRAKRLLTAAADELGLSLNRHASLCLEAAAKLSVLDAHTTTMPPTGARPIVSGINVLEVSIDAEANAIIGKWSHDKGLSFEDTLYCILDRAVWDYQPSTPIQRKAIRPAVPQREPFDPRRYARSPANMPALDAELSRRAIAAAERRTPVKRGMP